MRDSILPPLPGNAWLRWDRIQRLLPRAETVLEIGPGAGALSARLARRYRYTAVELSRESARRTQERVSSQGGRVVGGDIEAIDGSFDLVCAFEVLEHIDDDLAALRTWRERLKPAGYLLLSVPSNPGLWGKNDILAGHVRRYSRAGLRKVVQSAGFSVLRLETIGGPAGYGLLRARAMRARGILRSGVRSPEEQTLNSGWITQPGSLSGVLWWALMKPWRWMQRPFVQADFGTGLVALAQREED